jgi:hypothetical protein
MLGFSFPECVAEELRVNSLPKRYLALGVGGAMVG